MSKKVNIDEKDDEILEEEIIQDEENVEEKEVEVKSEVEEDNKEKDAKDLKIEELNDKYVRLLSEFENFRKRSEKEKEKEYDFGIEDLAVKLLPIIDNFERGISTLKDDEKEMPFAVGVIKIYEQLVKELENKGIVQIKAIGEKFDPNIHNAVMHEDNEEYGENEIIEEFQKGYIYKGKAIRPSMVKVAN